MICVVDEKDKPLIKSMWEYCFMDPAPFVEWYFEKIYNPQNTLGYYIDRELISCLQMLPYELEIMNKRLKMSLITGVSTRAEYRGRGYVSRLMRAAHKHLYQAGVDMACLIPFDFDFYTRLDYALASLLDIYSGELCALSKYNKIKVALSECYDDNALDLIYSEFCKHNCMIKRRKWFEILEDVKIAGGKCFVIPNRGYLIYSLSKDTINVREMVFLDPDALKSMLAFIYLHNAQVSRFRIRTRNNSIMQNLLVSKNITIEVNPYAMIRVINPKSVLKAAAANITDPKFRICFNIIDGHIEQNNKCFIVSPKNAQVVDHQSNVSVMGIQVFSGIAGGLISAEEASALGLISQTAGLEHLFEKRNNYMNLVGWM